MSNPLMTSLAPAYCALVIGASGGIGSAVVRQFEIDGNCRKVVRLSRRKDGFDVTDEDSMHRAAEVLKEEEFDLILCATGALTIDGVGPEKSIRALSQASMMAQFAVNAVGPALVLKHFAPLLARKKRAIFALLSARVGSIGDNALGGWISYRSSKAALNQIVHTAAIEISRINPLSLIVAVHPGTIATSLSEPFSSGHARSEPDEAATRILKMLDGLRSSSSGGLFADDGNTIPW